MAENKILNTRVQLKYDTLVNWTKTNPTLLAGELAVISLGNSHTATTPDNGTHPILFKAGPGAFNDLPFASALAADVYSWAKKPEEEFIAWVNTKIKKEIEDVVELPNPNPSAIVVANRTVRSEMQVIYVKTLPEIGIAGNNGDIAYYNESDNNVHVYLNGTGSYPTGWYTAAQVLGDNYGGVINSITEDPMDGKLRALITPPTGEINEEVTYRVLNGTFVHNQMLQNHCACHTVEWADGPTGFGMPVLSFQDNAIGLVVNGYYNVTDNTVYGYFDDITIEELGSYIDSLDLNEIAKLALKTALKTVSTGWKTMDEVISLVGSATSMSWGGTIVDITEAFDNDALYLLLSDKYYHRKNGKWITTDNGVGMLGQFAGAEIFNDPHNIAIGKASHAEGRET